MSYKRSVWCFTLPANLHDATGKQGIPVHYVSKDYTVVIGPLEEPDNKASYPHHHGYIKCPPQTSLTKGQAISLLKQIGAYKEDMYVHELETKLDRYIAYCFKGEDNTFSSAERAIKRAIDAVHDDGVKITPKRVKTKLVQNEGASFVARNKQVLDVVMGTPDERDKMSWIQTVDKEANMKAFMQSVVNFKGIVETAVMKNGITTTHPSFVDAPRPDQVNAILCIALLPMLVRRARIKDNVPALYFYGLPHCGKSHMFSQIPNYKKVATDADGVSRFRLDGDQTAVLLDDVDADFLSKPSNSKTLRALSIGEREIVKTMGDTQEIRAFVVCTSNSPPEFLQTFVPREDDKPQALEFFTRNANAMKRRFVSLEFTEECEPCDDFVDFEQTSLDIIARKAFEIAWNLLEHEPLKKLLSGYYGHISCQWDDDEIILYEKVFESSIEKRDDCIGLEPRTADPNPLVTSN